MCRGVNYIKFVLIVTILIVFLSACGKSLEQQITEQLELGQKYLIEQNYEEAIICFSKVIEIDPNLKDAYIRRGEVYFIWAGESEYDSAPEKYQAAVTDYEKAIMLENDSELLGEICDIYEIMAELYAERDKKKALEYLKKSYELEESEKTLKRIQELESGIKQWGAELTGSEEEVFETVIDALKSGSNEAINKALIYSNLLKLIERYGGDIFSNNHIWMDYGNTIDGEGASFELDKISEWLLVYYGTWKRGVADGDGILVVIAYNCRNEGYQEQFEKAVGTWSEGFAEGAFIYEETYYGGTQSDLLSTISGNLKRGLWEGRVKEKSSDEEVAVYSTFINGKALKTGEKEDSYNGVYQCYGIDENGELSSGVGHYNAAKENQKFGVIWSHHASPEIYKTGSLSYYLSKHGKIRGSLLHSTQ